MTAAEIWAVAGLVLGAAEMLVPGVFLLWIGLAAIGAASATAALGLAARGQIAAFVALAIVLIAAAVARQRRRRPRADPVNAPAAGLIGATCTAAEFRGGEGRVQFRDGTWQARLADGGAAPLPGDLLRVVGLDGTTLLVAHAPQPG